MKLVYTCLCTVLLLFACQSSEQNTVNKTITGITVLSQGDTLNIANGFQDAFLGEFKAAKEVGPHKFIGKYSLHVHYSDGSHDALKSTGSMHSGEGRYLKNEVNIVERYRQYGELDTVAGQLHTVAGLQVVLKTGTIEKAPEFFSNRIQEKLYKIAEKGGNLGEWAAAWNLDSTTFAKYKLRIQEGRGRFIYERDAWRIDEL